jgi:hypothetical protein
VLDHCDTMRRAGLHVSHGATERLLYEQRNLITRCRFMLQLPLAATTSSDRAMVQQAREWLAEHPEEIDNIERKEVNAG